MILFTLQIKRSIDFQQQRQTKYLFGQNAGDKKNVVTLVDTIRSVLAYGFDDFIKIKKGIAKLDKFVNEARQKGAQVLYGAGTFAKRFFGQLRRFNDDQLMPQQPQGVGKLFNMNILPIFGGDTVVI